MYDPQVYGLLVAVLLLHLGVLLYVYLRRESGTAEATAPEAELPVDATRREADAEIDPDDGGTVVCPECGTRNATGYDFCRRCVADLPGGVAGEGAEAFSNTA